MPIELEIADIRNTENRNEAFALILREKKGTRIMLIMIGSNEAKSLVLEMNKKTPLRPTAHDLFKNLADRCGCKLENVLIYHVEEGVFYAYLRIRTANGDLIELDSRTSDAVALALKYRVPIFIDDDVFAKVSRETVPAAAKAKDDEQEEMEGKDLTDEYIDQQLSGMSLEELEILLEGAVDSEDFELASKIHLEIEKRAG